jgi:hypothetical protein
MGVLTEASSDFYHQVFCFNPVATVRDTGIGSTHSHIFKNRINHYFSLYQQLECFAQYPRAIYPRQCKLEVLSDQGNT